MRRLLLVLLAVFLACPAQAAGPWSPGEAFPDVRLPEPVTPPSARPPAAGPHLLSELGASIVLINLYSEYCGPCIKEIPVLKRLQRLIQERGLDGKVLLVSIAAGDKAESVAKYMERYELPFPFYPDPSLSLHAKLGSYPVPTIFAVALTPSPIFLFKHTGELTGDPAPLLNKALRTAEPFLQNSN